MKIKGVRIPTKNQNDIYVQFSYSVEDGVFETFTSLMAFNFQNGDATISRFDEILEYELNAKLEERNPAGNKISLNNFAISIFPKFLTNNINIEEIV